MYVSPTACNVLCVRFTQLLFAYQLGSFSRATLDTGGWLGFARQGLSPYKKRQAALGAPTPQITGWLWSVAEKTVRVHLLCYLLSM